MGTIAEKACDKAFQANIAVPAGGMTSRIETECLILLAPMLGGYFNTTCGNILYNHI